MVKNKAEVYKCSVCGNIVEVNYVGGGELHCCGKAMNLLTENTEDAVTEKHIPIIAKVGNGIKVIVGEVEHPMKQSHYIEWIELMVEDKMYKQFLSPEQKPEAIFELSVAGKIVVREYCNLHGLWKAEVEI